MKGLMVFPEFAPKKFDPWLNRSTQVWDIWESISSLTLLEVTEKSA